MNIGTYKKERGADKSSKGTEIRGRCCTNPRPLDQVFWSNCLSRSNAWVYPIHYCRGTYCKSKEVGM